MEPEYYGAFRCLGADCPDTCCEGWGVVVDRNTFNKYRQCSDPLFQPLFQDLVTVNQVPTDSNYASIKLNDARCPFLSEKLCSIQTHLGEDHLSHTCATFPRNFRYVDGTLERSLDLSCPEAARLALTDPRPTQFNFGEADRAASAHQNGVPALTAASPESALDAWQTRTLVIAILQNRRHSLSQRLTLVAHLCDHLTGIAESENQERTVDYSAQLRLVLDLITARIRIDFVSRRYLDLYQEFASGIQMEAGSDWNQLTLRYAHACRDHYMPFMDCHEYLLENYLVAYAYKTLFPLGSAIGRPSAEPILNPAEQYMLMASYYSVTKAVMIGLAGKYKSRFGVDHVVRCIQSNSKALEHCTSYPQRVLQILAGKGIHAAGQMANLIGQ